MEKLFKINNKQEVPFYKSTNNYYNNVMKVSMNQNSLKSMIKQKSKVKKLVPYSQMTQLKLFNKLYQHNNNNNNQTLSNKNNLLLLLN